MVELEENLSAEDWLARAKELIPKAISKAREVKQFRSRWKAISLKLEQIPSTLSDLSSHPFFSKNTLCNEQLQSVSLTLTDAVDLADLCLSDRFEGKLRMQSDLDSLSGKLDLNLRDCGVLIKTGVLGESSASLPPPPPENPTSAAGEPASGGGGIRELLARLQIGNIEAKHRALDRVAEAMREDEKSVTAAIGRSNVAALVSLLSAPAPLRVREKAAAVICSLAESGGCEAWLVSEGALPPLIRLTESSTAGVGREKAVIALQRLTAADADVARAVAGHGGVRPLVEICRSSSSSSQDSVSRAAAACTLRNVSAAPETRRSLADEGAIDAMVSLLDDGGPGVLLGAKEYAAECLQNLTAGGEDLRREVVRRGGPRSLLRYLESAAVPQEAAAAAMRNLVTAMPSVEALAELGFFSGMVHVLGTGSGGARQAAAAAVCRAVSAWPEEGKRAAGEAGCMGPLVELLWAKSGGAREAAAQAVAGLVTAAGNRRELKREEKGVAGLVQLLEAGPGNNAKKYAVFALGAVSSSRRCRRLMVSYGAIGYLKKLVELEVPGAKKLLERLERGRLKSFFVRN